MYQWMKLNEEERNMFEKYIQPLKDQQEKKIEQITKKFKKVATINKNIKKMKKETLEKAQKKMKQKFGRILQKPYAFDLRYVDIPLYYRWDYFKCQR